MLNDEICKLREKLHESILNQNDYAVTYKLSVELDQLIAKYYSTQVKVVTNNENGNAKKSIVAQQCKKNNNHKSMRKNSKTNSKKNTTENLAKM